MSPDNQCLKFDTLYEHKSKSKSGWNSFTKIDTTITGSREDRSSM